MEAWLENLLECSVCFERLDETGRGLPCQHTFCKKCLQDIVANTNELHCPECRMLFNTKVDDLPPNVLLVRILDGLRTASNSRQQTDGSNAATTSNAAATSNATAVHHSMSAATSTATAVHHSTAGAAGSIPDALFDRYSSYDFSPGYTTTVNQVWFYSPSDFYCQPSGSARVFSHLMLQLSTTYGGPAGASFALQSDPSIGEAVVALYSEDNTWCRAMVMDAKGADKFKVQFVDYGNEAVVSKSNIRQIRPQFLQLRKQGLRMSLSDCRPVDGGRQWPKMSTETVFKYFGSETVTCMILSKDNNDRFHVHLYINGSSVADRLIADGLAAAVDGARSSDVQSAAETTTAATTASSPTTTAAVGATTSADSAVGIAGVGLSTVPIATAFARSSSTANNATAVHRAPLQQQLMSNDDVHGVVGARIGAGRSDSSPGYRGYRGGRGGRGVIDRGWIDRVRGSGIRARGRGGCMGGDLGGGGFGELGLRDWVGERGRDERGVEIGASVRGGSMGGYGAEGRLGGVRGRGGDHGRGAGVGASGRGGRICANFDRGGRGGDRRRGERGAGIGASGRGGSMGGDLGGGGFGGVRSGGGERGRGERGAGIGASGRGGSIGGDLGGGGFGIGVTDRGGRGFGGGVSRWGGIEDLRAV